MVWKCKITPFFIQDFKSSNCEIFQGMSHFLQSFTTMSGHEWII